MLTLGGVPCRLRPMVEGGWWTNDAVQECNSQLPPDSSQQVLVYTIAKAAGSEQGFDDALPRMSELAKRSTCHQSLLVGLPSCASPGPMETMLTAFGVDVWSALPSLFGDGVFARSLQWGCGPVSPSAWCFHSACWSRRRRCLRPAGTHISLPHGRLTVLCLATMLSRCIFTASAVDGWANTTSSRLECDLGGHSPDTATLRADDYERILRASFDSRWTSRRMNRTKDRRDAPVPGQFDLESKRATEQCLVGMAPKRSVVLRH